MLSNTKQGAADDDNVLVVPLLGLTKNRDSKIVKN
jgi:hypothetical protein